MNPKAPKAPKKASPQLSHQLWGQVAVHCDIDTLPALFRVNRNTRLCLSEVQEKKIFELHFPHYLEKDKALGKEEKKEEAAHAHRYLEKFKAARTKDYKNLSESEKKLLASVKCGQLDEVKKRITTSSYAKYYAADLRDSNKRSLCYWAKRNNNQATNNYIYELIKKDFEADAFTKIIFQDDRDLDVVRQDWRYQTLLSWAIRCFQSNEVLADLVKRGANINHVFYTEDLEHLEVKVTLIKLAVDVGNHDAFVFLCNQPGINYLSEDLFKDAAERGHLNIVKYLVVSRDIFPSPRVMNKAVRGKNIPVIAYLLDTNRELLTDEILKEAEDEEVIEYLTKRKSSEYEVAKENLRNEIQKLPENSLLKTAANTFLIEIVRSKKTSAAEIKLLTTTLDQTTQLLRNINQRTMTKEAIDDYITQANEHVANLPSSTLRTVLYIFTCLLISAYIIALFVNAPLCALICVMSGLFSAGLADAADKSYAAKLNADPRGQNLPLYETLSKSMKKIGEMGRQSALQNQSLFAIQKSTIQVVQPLESKRSTAPVAS